MTFYCDGIFLYRLINVRNESKTEGIMEKEQGAKIFSSIKTAKEVQL